jgi:hypothetical protein
MLNSDRFHTPCRSSGDMLHMVGAERELNLDDGSPGKLSVECFSQANRHSKGPHNRALALEPCGFKARPWARTARREVGCVTSWFPQSGGLHASNATARSYLGAQAPGQIAALRLGCAHPRKRMRPGPGRVTRNGIVS